MQGSNKKRGGGCNAPSGPNLNTILLLRADSSFYYNLSFPYTHFLSISIFSYAKRIISIIFGNSVLGRYHLLYIFSGRYWPELTFQQSMIRIWLKYLNLTRWSGFATLCFKPAWLFIISSDSPIFTNFQSIALPFYQFVGPLILNCRGSNSTSVHYRVSFYCSRLKLVSSYISANKDISFIERNILVVSFDPELLRSKFNQRTLQGVPVDVYRISSLL